MIDKDNPAGRLWNLLTRFREEQTPTRTLGAIMAELVGISEADRAELLRRMAGMLELPSKIRRDVARLSWDGTVLIEDLDQIEKSLLRFNIDAQVETWAPHLNPVAIAQLRSVSSILHQHVPERTADDDQVHDLGESIRRLIGEVKEDTHIDDNLRSFLLDHLLEMEQAVWLVAVVGLEGLRKAYERTVGGLYTHEDLAKRAAETSVWDRFGRVLGGVVLLLTAGTATTELIQAWFPQLPSAGAEIEGDGSADVDVTVIDIDVPADSPQPIIMPPESAG